MRSGSGAKVPLEKVVRAYRVREIATFDMTDMSVRKGSVLKYPYFTDVHFFLIIYPQRQVYSEIQMF